MTDVRYHRLEAAGRLGNQMWQIAATAGIAAQISGTPRFTTPWSYRPWFRVPDEWFGHHQHPYIDAEEWEGLAHIDVAARMYLQDLGLFVDIAPDIRDIFAPSDQAMDVMVSDDAWDIIVGLRPLALHVRRGDTVTQPAGYQPLATLDYYERAVSDFFIDDVIVFSDDIPWCRQHLPAVAPSRTWHFIDHGEGRSHRPNLYRRQPAMDWLDLQLMARCDSFVISNSTYAWWSAWLAGAKGVRYPEVWWGPNLAHIDPTLMIPEDRGWVQVPC